MFWLINKAVESVSGRSTVTTHAVATTPVVAQAETTQTFCYRVRPQIDFERETALAALNLADQVLSIIGTLLEGARNSEIIPAALDVKKAKAQEFLAKIAQITATIKETVAERMDSTIDNTTTATGLSRDDVEQRYLSLYASVNRTLSAAHNLFDELSVTGILKQNLLVETETEQRASKDLVAQLTQLVNLPAHRPTTRPA